MVDDVVLQHRSRPGRELPQELDQHGRIDRPVPDDALQVLHDVDILHVVPPLVEHPLRPDHGQQCDGRHEPARAEEQDLGRGGGALTFQGLAEQSPAEEGQQIRQRTAHVDDAAHLAGNGVFLRQGVGQAIDGARHHAEGHGRQEQAAEEQRIGRGGQGHGPIDEGRHKAEQDEVGAVAPAERAPTVADEAEDEAEDQRQPDPELEHRQFIGLEMHPVLEEERHRNVDHATCRPGKIHQDQQQTAEGEGLEAFPVGQYRG